MEETPLIAINPDSVRFTRAGTESHQPTGPVAKTGSIVKQRRAMNYRSSYIANLRKLKIASCLTLIGMRLQSRRIPSALCVVSSLAPENALPKWTGFDL